MDGIRFRRAKAADLSAIVRLLAEDELGRGREDASLPLNAKYISAFRAVDEDPNQHVIVAIMEDAVVGCMQVSIIHGLSRMGMTRGQIESVRVVKRLRGKGVGKQMIEHALELCRAKKCGLVQLTSDKTRKDALAFYEKLGFVASHEGLKLVL
jgi:ribosomal protein S18 acetylase RimI-like enzyme